MWIEILTVRHALGMREDIENLVGEILSERHDNDFIENIVCFERADNFTDISLHITHSKPSMEKPSEYGLRLKETLRHFGPVDHSIWHPKTPTLQ